MAAASYTHDLIDWIPDGTITAWDELTGAAGGSLPDEADTESALQATNTVSQATNSNTSACGMGRTLGASVTFTTGQVALVWHGHGVATALRTYANHGLQVAFLTSAANWKAFTVAGVDVPPFPYGKWTNSAVDPTLTADTTNGTPPTGGTNIFGIGSICFLTAAVAKGQPHVCDMIRYGRAEARFNGGDLANGYATFNGFAVLNDAQTARWGLIQETLGGYLWKGLITLGHSTAVDFRDSNKAIFIQDCRKVSSTFNKIEVRQASSRVDWTGISITCASPNTTASKGAFQVIDNADVNFESCTFTDMDTFIFLTGATVNSTIFRRCGQVTVGGSTFTNCIFDNSTAATAALASSPANASLISNSNFVSDGTGYGIEITGTAANFTLTNVNFTGYAGSNGSTGNEAVFVNIASGSMNLTVSGGTTPSVRTAGAVVTIISGAVNVTVRATTDTGAVIQDARVHLEAAAGGPFPTNATVTVANSGTTATVTHTSHGMATNDKVVIRGASHDANNGVFTITVTDTNTYTYTMGSSPGSNPTGTITSTFVVLNGLTNASGEISMSRVFPSNQPVTGRSRKSSGAPYYKNAPLTGTVSSSTGGTFTAVMISDD